MSISVSVSSSLERRFCPIAQSRVGLSTRDGKKDVRTGDACAEAAVDDKVVTGKGSLWIFSRPGFVSKSNRGRRFLEVVDGTGETGSEFEDRQTAGTSVSRPLPPSSSLGTHTLSVLLENSPVEYRLQWQCVKPEG